jgi:hypothetical protein
MILVFRILGLLVRIVLHSSPVAKELTKVLMFDPQPYAVNNLKDNSFVNNLMDENNRKMSMMGKSENYFSVRK